MLLSDRDIKQLLNQEIVIYPFNENDLTPVGYNLNPSDFVFSLQSKELLKAKNGFFQIKPHHTVLILTKEAVWVSKKLAGTFHSKVGVVSTGFGHISTTLDPGWNGLLLISLNNPTDSTLLLATNQSFVTLMLYQLKTPALKKHDNLPRRADILKRISDDVLSRHINQKQREFLSKIQGIINNENVYEEFERIYTELSQLSREPILTVLKRNIRLTKINLMMFWISVVCEVALIAILLLKIISSILYPIPLLNIIDKSTFVALFAVLIACFQWTNSIKKE
jgi:deoxycytidine triphosphate deaminase